MSAAGQEQTRQNTTTHYLRKERLEARLRELFPDVKDFKIRVRIHRPARRCSRRGSVRLTSSRCRMTNIHSSRRGELRLYGMIPPKLHRLWLTFVTQTELLYDAFRE